MPAKPLSGRRILLTGASGGLGVHLARALAARGADLGLVAYPGDGLPALHEEVRALGVRTFFAAADLTESSARRAVVDRFRSELGPPQVLINNAGDERTAFYHTLDEETIVRLLRINLEAAMVLTRLVLPDLLANGGGHLIQMSSLAGKSGPACQEAYAAAKAGLVGFNQALRASYRRRGIRATVICPGFVHAGIYARSLEQTGIPAPSLLGVSRPEKVVAAVLRALAGDLPEILINPRPVRPLFAVAQLFPGLGAWLVEQTGGHDYFRRIARKLGAGMPDDDPAPAGQNR